LALATAAISGLSIFLNGFAVKEMNDPAVFTTLKNSVAAVLLGALAASAVRRADLSGMTRRSWAGLGVIGVIGGSIPFLLFFSGLALASSPSAAFIHKTLFVWVALLAVPFLGERLGALQVLAIGGLLLSQLLIAPPSGVSWGVGETMIAAATLLWSVEVVLAKRLLVEVPSAVVGAARLGIGLVVLFGFLTVTGRLPMVVELSSSQWTWVLLTGMLLAGYVATWFAALSRAPAVVVTSVLVLGAPITATLDAIVRGTAPAMPAVAGHILIVTAVATVAAIAWARARRTAFAADAVPAPVQ
jgi:drug/metabolite transporter (DMT)-like permease